MNVRLFFPISILFIVSNIFAARELLIPAVRQAMSATCWAAVSEMVLQAYKFYVAQATIVQRYAAGQNIGNELFGKTSYSKLKLDCQYVRLEYYYLEENISPNK